MAPPRHWVEAVAWAASWPFRRLWIGLDDWSDVGRDDEEEVTL